MLFTLISLVVVLKAPLVASMGNAVVSNLCPYDIWIWSVDQAQASAPIHVPARTKYSEPLRSACNGCGTSIKVSKTQQLVGGAQTQFEYSISDSQIWYDISLVDCANGQNAGSCPGHDKGLAINSPESKCGKIDCAGGSYCPTQVYYVDYPVQKLGLAEPVFTCPGAGTGIDIHMNVCSDEALLKRSIAGRLLVDLDG